MTVLDNYVEPHEDVTVAVAGGKTMPLATFGLGLEQLIWLAREYGEQLAPIYAQARAGKLDETEAISVVTDLSEEVPLLVNMAVFFALRCEDENELSKIAKMPLATRVEILEACARLTFRMEGGEGKLWEIVKKTFQKAAGLMGQAELP